MEFLTKNIIDYSAIAEMLTRLAMDLFFTFLLVRVIYYSLKKDQDYTFTLYVFNVLIYFICYFMSNIGVSIGFAFGLFALFGVLRYRTITIPIKEMTYLFTVIAIAIINALSTSEISLAEILLSNLFIIGFIFFMEKVWFRVQQGFNVITYEKVEMIIPDKREELLQDLKKRTGLDITEIEVADINYLTDSAKIKIFYKKHHSGGVSRILEE